MERETRALTRLSGRATELTQLEQIHKDVGSGRGRLVILTGPAGVGKSAVCETFLRRLRDAEPAALTLATRCVEGTSSNRPYGPFRDLLALLSGEPDETRLPSLVGTVAPGWSPGARAAGRSALFEQYHNLCRAIAEQRPLTLFIDDLQWCDRSSLDLLTHLGLALGSLPVLLLGSFEKTDSEGAVSIKGVTHRVGANAVELGIRELEGDAIRGLAQAVLGGSLGGGLGDWIVDAAQGSPLRALYLTRWLQEQGVIRKRLFRLSAPARSLPDPSMETNEIIQGWLDALGPSIRWTLEAAALSGAVIDSTVVAGQVGSKGDDILSHLRAAEDLGVIVRVGERRWAAGGRSLRFRFCHPHLRTLLLTRVTGKRRDHLIGRAAEMLERLAGESAPEIADEIAALHLAGDADQRILEWTVRAADLCERLFAVYEAEEFLLIAAQRTEDEVQRLHIQNRLAKMFAATGREPEAESMLERLFLRGRECGDIGIEVNAGALLCWLQLERGGDPFELSQLAGHLVDAARRFESPEELVKALELSCVIAERVGRAEEALLMAEEAFHVAEVSKKPEVLAQAAYRLARVHVSWGSPEEGRTLAERALGVFGELDAADGIAVCHDLLGLANFRAGTWDAALHHWESALKRMAVGDSADQRVTMQANIAELATLRGEFERALELFNAGLEAAEVLDDPSLVLRCRTGIARLAFERGDNAAVLNLTDQIRRLLPESGAWKVNFLTTAIRALAHLELGDELQAWQEAARLEQLYQGKEGWFEHRAEGDAVRMRVIDLDADTWLAGVVAQQGIGEAAENDLYGEGFLQYHRACVQARDKPDEARASAERAIELFEKLGAMPMLNRTRQLLDGLPTKTAEASQPDEEQIDDAKIDKWFDSLEG